VADLALGRYDAVLNEMTNARGWGSVRGAAMNSKGELDRSGDTESETTAAERPASHRSFARIERGGELLAVRVEYSGFDFGMSGEYVAETFGLIPSYLCVVQLRDFPSIDAWRDGRHFRLPVLRSGSSQIYDLRHAWTTAADHPFDNVHFHLSQAAISTIADELGVRRIELSPPPFSGEPIDATIEYLARAVLPAFQHPGQLTALFTDHIFSAAVLHLARTYGNLAPSVALPRGGLAPWQERRATELLMASLASDINLADLAASCGLSPRYFARAFRISMGLPPHKWLLQQRVARAKELLLHSSDSLGQVALACGFADQSHLTRVFSRAVGATPWAWRRARKS
jgi:AraC family transcriptional regulator